MPVETVTERPVVKPLPHGKKHTEDETKVLEAVHKRFPNLRNLRIHSDAEIHGERPYMLENTEHVRLTIVSMADAKWYAGLGPEPCDPGRQPANPMAAEARKFMDAARSGGKS